MTDPAPPADPAPRRPTGGEPAGVDERPPARPAGGPPRVVWVALAAAAVAACVGAGVYYGVYQAEASDVRPGAIVPGDGIKPDRDATAPSSAAADLGGRPADAE